MLEIGQGIEKNVDKGALWGAAFVAYLVFWAIWSRYDLMIGKPNNPSPLEKEKWDAIEKRHDRRTLIWIVGLVIFLAAWVYFTQPF